MKSDSTEKETTFHLPNPAFPVTSSGVRVDTVRISNFRSLRNIEATLGDTCLILGMNNSGKTSFLRALHLALSSDRRLISADDFHVNEEGRQADQIVVDLRIIPIGEDGDRVDEFPERWIEADFGGGELIATDSNDRQFIAVRTQITLDSITSDFTFERRRLEEWPDFDNWDKAPSGNRVSRFSQLLSFFIDAQRDVLADLRTRSSYFGKLVSKIEIPEQAIAELEGRLAELNNDIVGSSDVLDHLREALAGLNRTVPAFGEGVELTPVSKRLRDLTKGMGVQFSDNTGSSFPIESHGMGTRSWASLLSFEAYVSWTAKLSESQEKPFHPVLFLEEPEAHLHPNAQRAVHDQISRGLGQRIVSTHSPYIVGQVKLEDLLHFSKHGIETRIRHLPTGELDTEEVRKIRREVMRSRGELLFANAAVLFEGETEEQALPMFARRHWDRYPFERGVAFVGVGGDGNYFPFIRVFEAFQIPWFIFSDGEPKSRKKVEAALTKAFLEIPHSRVITIPNDQSIEEYLIQEGYQTELKAAVKEQMRPYHNSQHEENKIREIDDWNDERLLDYLKNHKTSMAVHWANAIIHGDSGRAIPPAIRQLLDAVDQLLSEARTRPEK